MFTITALVGAGNLKWRSKNSSKKENNFSDLIFFSILWVRKASFAKIPTCFSGLEEKDPDNSRKRTPPR